MANNPTIDAMNKAAEHLPPGWTITIEIERDAGYVLVFDADGVEHEDFPCNRESITQDILDALDYAIDQVSSAEVEPGQGTT